MASFQLTKKAVSDLASIWNYTVDEWLEQQAEKYYNLILDTCESILENPKIGKFTRNYKRPARPPNEYAHHLLSSTSCSTDRNNENSTCSNGPKKEIKKIECPTIAIANKGLVASNNVPDIEEP